MYITYIYAMLALVKKVNPQQFIFFHVFFIIVICFI